MLSRTKKIVWAGYAKYSVLVHTQLAIAASVHRSKQGPTRISFPAIFFSPSAGRIRVCLALKVLVEGEKAVGVRLRGKGGGGKGRRPRSIRARRAVVMNADRWAAAKLLPEGTIPDEKR